jgi:2-desacetyl-2-hydroxyethyl bacteriochlorophyllide A dehydrogenase
MTERNPTIVFTQPGQVMIEQRPLPEASQGQVLVRTKRTLISTGTELTILSGDFPKDSAWSRYGRFPFVPGYDNVGEVIAVGKGVDDEWVGRRVASYGQHARYATIDAYSLRPIDEEVPDEYAVFSTMAEIALNGVRRGGVRLGDAVVIYGAGLVGQLAARFCGLCGARPVVVIDLAQLRLSRLPKESFFIALNPKANDVVAEVRKETGGRMADVVFEATGNQGLIPAEFNCLREQGKFVVLSSPRGKTELDLHDLCNSPSYTIIGAHNRSHPRHSSPDNPWTGRRDAEFFFGLVSTGELDVGSLISHRIPYSEAPEIYRQLLKDRSGFMGVILQWD